MSNSSLFVIDAHAMAYRAYYAMQGQNLTHPVTGQPTTAIFGFFRMLFKLLVEYKPDFTAVTWDAPGGSFRNEMYTEYKAHRKPMPDDLRYQIDEIKEIISKCGFIILEEKGYEADDLMGSLSNKFSKKLKVILLTGDKDCYQLLNENVHMLRGIKGVSEFTEINPEWVKSELGVTVNEIPDYMALVGDASDNIPGAKGVGPKSAEKLIQEYGTIDKIYQHIDSIKPDGLKKKLSDSKENVFLSRKLAEIDLGVASIENLDENKIRTPDFLSNDVIQMFRHEGYTQIYNELLKAKNKTGENNKLSADMDPKIKSKKTHSKHPAENDLFTQNSISVSTKEKTEYRMISDLTSLTKELENLTDAKEISVDTETNSTNSMTANLVGISLSAKEKDACYISLPPEESLFKENGIDLNEALPLLKEFLENPRIAKIGQNIKYDYIILRRNGIDLQNIHFDTMIASYLLNPNMRRHNLDDMALDLLGHENIKYEEIAGSGKNKTTFDKIDPENIRDYACEDADITFRIYNILKKSIKEQDLSKVNEKIEIPLIRVLASMEAAGVSIDTEYFEGLSKDYEKKLNKLEKQIHTDAGEPFNINSTKELQVVLFETLNLPRGKKTKTGYSTDQSVLEDLRGMHQVVDRLLEHRKYSKLKSTYVDALPRLIHPVTGRIHTSFNQTIAATGRLSSNEPNLQNIPIREDTGRAIRRGFIAAPGCEILSLDYSQIELRIMAHYSKDPALEEAFISDKVDIHARTASSLFGVNENNVNADQRSKAKVVNFSIIYGVTDFGLGQNLNIPRNEAATYIERFFEKYPGVRRFMDETVEFAEKNGYVETLSGRKRQITDINSSNRFRKEGAKRTAVNTPVQGTSADIIKLAMIEIFNAFQKEKLKSKMILQVHDELLFDVIPEEKETVLTIAKEKMENAMKLRVPLRVDYRFGKNWDEAH
ncbi:MAG: DNA polymerase I [Spirochaetia bacterium]|nr:DNA polymerase I [Spirochaetia bacterium]